ncbi:tail fiber protein [Flavivirga sp. 57AJ16]|uniref:tail fiber protein n=1 Tax=Flavivirga sp. 57AJ16 TaxID=3025307 RepID=UPI002365C69E|nr:tail fiber protein [Flavivirga sp. 57AJ16]MDD7886022.1 tail fiber protein [Flavivirga sp. 57AJ16]
MIKKHLIICSLCLFVTIQINSQNTFPTSGSAGIGTTSPNKDLEIKGGDGIGIRLFNNQANTWDILNTQYGKLDFVRGGTNTFMRIDQFGNVGIGTTNPLKKLYINASFDDGLALAANNAILGDNGSGSFTQLLFWNGSNAYYGRSQTGIGVDNHFFRTQGITRLIIKDNGNVGIGTTTPDAKLAVKGNIHTNEVKVDLLGAVAPDYVFYKDYALKTLTEVENYIAKQGHLPNIPSAKEMEAEGIKLKEMNLKLLEKIEEITLYTIGQEKEIKAYKNELQSQKDIIKNLEDRLQKIEILLSSKNN